MSLAVSNNADDQDYQAWHDDLSSEAEACRWPSVEYTQISGCDLVSAQDLIQEAASELGSLTGIILSRQQMKALLEESELMDAVVDAGEVDLQSAQSLANFLVRQLIDEDWPKDFSLSATRPTGTERFLSRIRSAAFVAGYGVSIQSMLQAPILTPEPESATLARRVMGFLRSARRAS